MRIALESLYRALWCDISGGKTVQKRRSRSAYVVLGQDELERIFILEAFAAHIRTTEFMEKLFRAEERWQLRVMGFDVTATQGVFVDGLEKEAKLMVRHLPTIHRQSLQGEKVARIENVVQPVAAQGRLFRGPEGQNQELKGEWESFPTGFYMDIMDCLACGIQFLLPKKPKKMQENEQSRELRNYLKNSGASAEYIERRLREVFPGVT